MHWLTSARIAQNRNWTRTIASRRRPADDYPPFAELPVRLITAGPASHQIAVHVSGRFTPSHPPIVCVPGFTRNMTDFADFMRHYRDMASADWPFVLVDLTGRGRSSDGRSSNAYSAHAGAHDLSCALRALGISQAVFVGQGHGGQAVMSLAAQHPGLIAAAILINAGPNTNSRGLVRLRSNMKHLTAARNIEQFRTVSRQILSADYPGVPETVLDNLALRGHFLDRRGRSQPLSDPQLITFLAQFDLDDIFEPQWQLFDALAASPLMLIRTQLTDRLDMEIFDQMVERRPDATIAKFIGEASPALLNNQDEVGQISDFVTKIVTSPRL